MPGHHRHYSWSEYWRLVGLFARRQTVASIGGRTFAVSVVTAVAAFVIRFVGAQGDDKLFDLVSSALAGILAGSSVAVVLFLIHLSRAPWLLHDEESGRACAAEAREQRLQERLKPGLTFVMQDCCRPRPEVACVAVESVGPQTVNEAFVYVSVPNPRIFNREAKWDSMPPNYGLRVQHGVHYHTAPLVVVGDQPGQFFLHFSYGNQQIGPGQYELHLSATGQDVTAAVARLVIVCGPQRQLSVRLESGPSL